MTPSDKEDKGVIVKSFIVLKLRGQRVNHTNRHFSQDG